MSDNNILNNNNNNNNDNNDNNDNNNNNNNILLLCLNIGHSLKIVPSQAVNAVYVKPHDNFI